MKDMKKQRLMICSLVDFCTDEDSRFCGHKEPHPAVFTCKITRCGSQDGAQCILDGHELDIALGVFPRSKNEQI